MLALYPLINLSREMLYGGLRILLSKHLGTP